MMHCQTVFPLSNVAIKLITKRPLKAILFCLSTLPSPPIIDFLRYFPIPIGYYGTVFYLVGYSTVQYRHLVTAPTGSKAHWTISHWTKAHC